MALDIQASTDEQIQNDQTRQAALHKSVMDSLKGDKVQEGVLKDLGLSPEAEPKSEPKARVPIKQVEEEQEEEQQQQDEITDEETEEVKSEESEEEESEEVVPKSKVQKRFDELTARIKAQEKQLEELRAIKEAPKDEVTKQLESMTSEQLKAAKLEVRKAQIRAQDDDAKLNELLALEDKIDSAMQQGPAKFQRDQAQAYAQKAQEIADSGDIPNIEKVAPSIIKLANELYQKYPMLQKDVNGQATALELAANHFKALSSVPGDKAKETDLKRQNNNLKKKVTLDTKGSKVNADKSKLDSLRKSAIGGTMKQKVDLVRTHPMFNVDKMIPDEFR